MHLGHGVEQDIKDNSCIIFYNMSCFICTINNFFSLYSKFILIHSRKKWLKCIFHPLTFIILRFWPSIKKNECRNATLVSQKDKKKIAYI